MNTKNVVGRGVSVLALSATLLGLGCGLAFAATPAASSPVGEPMSSTGVHLYDNSAETLVLTGVSGDNEGVPSVGSVLTSGQGYQDFEVTFRATKSTTVTADYSVQNSAGTPIGSAVIKLSNNEWGDTSVSGTFTATDGTTLPMSTGSSNGHDDTVMDSSGTQINVPAADATALVNTYCSTPNSLATCVYTPSSREQTTNMHLLAMGYTEAGGDSPGTVSVSSGYNSSVSDSWSVSVTASMELGGVMSEGVTATYGQTVTWQNTFTAGESIQVNPGQTGYIWGQVPVVQYTGTLQIKLGNTTWNVSGAQLTQPDPTRTLSQFTTGTYYGNNPLQSPQTPPTGVLALSGTLAR